MHSQQGRSVPQSGAAACNFATTCVFVVTWAPLPCELCTQEKNNKLVLTSSSHSLGCLQGSSSSQTNAPDENNRTQVRLPYAVDFFFHFVAPAVDRFPLTYASVSWNAFCTTENRPFTASQRIRIRERFLQSIGHACRHGHLSLKTRTISSPRPRKSSLSHRLPRPMRRRGRCSSRVHPGLPDRREPRAASATCLSPPAMGMMMAISTSLATISTATAVGARSSPTHQAPRPCPRTTPTQRPPPLRRRPRQTPRSRTPASCLGSTANP